MGKNLVRAEAVGGDADASTIETVYVGVPDVLERDQVIRLHALSLATQQYRVNDDDSKTLDTAARYEAFIADGSTDA